MHRNPTWLAVVVALSTGCSTSRIQVRLKSPDRLALVAERPLGDRLVRWNGGASQLVLAPGQADAELSQSHLFETARAHLHRNADGSIALTCADCGSPDHQRLLFAPDPDGWISESLEEELEPDEQGPAGDVSLQAPNLALRWSVGGHRFPRFNGTAVTPWSNVAGVREHLEPNRAPGWICLAAGALLETVAVVQWARLERDPSFKVQAPVMLGIGLGFDAVAAYLLFRPAENRPLGSGPWTVRQ